MTGATKKTKTTTARITRTDPINTDTDDTDKDDRGGGGGDDGGGMLFATFTLKKILQKSRVH